MQIATDDIGRGTALARAIGPACDFTVTAIDQLAAPGAATRLLVCDIDLTNSETVHQARPILAAYRAARVTLIFVVSPGSHHEETQAHSLGAHLVVPRNRAAAVLPDAATRILAQTVTEAVDAAFEAVGGALAAAGAGRKLATSRIEESSGTILSAIEAAGIGNWLNHSWSIDEVTAQHCLLVAGFCAGFAVHLGFAQSDRLDLTLAAMLHDVGKARVPPAILHKPGRLTTREMAIVRQHPIFGWDILKAQNYGSPRLLDAVLHHHEFLDGSGYPDGLKGSKISDFVRIITLCDIFGALLERRSYKPPMAPELALDVMREMGPKLDADLLRAFTGFVFSRVMSEDEAGRLASRAG
ncbi:HD-GYP domain-containing protein [Pelagibacterium xiamenense]|uniref:HD-GYP domain-containing protein n=1 Tax=Pelagibacterium xiamenense TaxID=2901140 RepID=UPI001E5287BB|nr:HD domain-containing phosphohydrolase [Pelagibacterium xiamenense]MCD7058614.1 HD domain-containing protein [Pelagibacterium xiamenense]